MRHHGWTLKTWCSVKEVRHKRPHTVWFHLYETSRIGPVFVHAGLCARLDVHQTLKRPKVASPSLWQPSASSPPTTLLQATLGVALARLGNPLWETKTGKAGMNRSQNLLHHPHGPNSFVPNHQGFCWAKSKVQKPLESQKLPHNSRKGNKCPFQAETRSTTSSWTMCHDGAMTALQELTPQGDREMDSLVSPTSRGQKGTWLRGKTAGTRERSEGDEGPGTMRGQGY